LIVVRASQFEGIEYTIVAEPKLTPVTTPDDEMVAIVGFILTQEPPANASVNVEVPAMHTFVAPMIAEGDALTVTGYVAEQAKPPSV
jgi:hypothetical protein